MLYELYIENLAVIECARIPLSNRLNVLTGETGAGKSILINAINSILGQRMTKDVVRTGEKKAIVTALFTNLDSSICSRLDKLNVSHDEDMITITREIFADGGTVARINSKAVAISVLKDIGQHLVNVHGQHDNQILLNPDRHIEIIDSFGDDYELLNDYQTQFRKLQSLAKTINGLNKVQASKRDRIEILRSRISEIGAINPQLDEESTLETEYLASLNAEKIMDALNSAYRLLDDSNESAMESILTSKRSIERYTNVFPTIEPLVDRLSNVYIELQDISEELLTLSNSIDLDHSRLEYLAKRRMDLNHIKKKYSLDLEGIIKLYRDAMQEVETLEDSTHEIETLSVQRDALLLEVTEKAKKLSNRRIDIVNRFKSKVCTELKDLNMPNVIFEVHHKVGKLTINGMDNMEFLISANAGEPPKPINKIASGGELSRIMLALKTVLSDKDKIPTLIFDEIDTGVSGKTAQKIGYKLKEISNYRQVICVTHLSQIATVGDHHLLIEKSVKNDRTSTTVTSLDHAGRVQEIARIMNGETLTDTALKNADELLRIAHGGVKNW